MRSRKKRTSLKPLYFIVPIAGLALFLALFFISPQLTKKEMIVPLPLSDPTKDAKQLLIEKGVHVVSVDLASDSGILVTLPGGTVAYLDPSKDLEMQVNSLQIVIQRLTIEGKTARRIDLRYKDPVVVY